MARRRDESVTRSLAGPIARLPPSARMHAPHGRHPHHDRPAANPRARRARGAAAQRVAPAARRAMFERAQRVLSAGVASSYQLRDPWPIYLVGGEGSRCIDADGTERIDFHNGFGSMVQGHAHPAISRAVDRAAARSARTSPSRRRTRSSSRRSSARRLASRSGGTRTRAPRRRWTRSGSRARIPGRDTIVKIFGSYHGHHDAVMVSIGARTARSAPRDDYVSLPYGAGIPQAITDLTVAVPFNDATRWTSGSTGSSRRVASPPA